MILARQSTAHLQPLTPRPGVIHFNFHANEQEAHVEEFRRMLEAKGAWRREDHGEVQDQLWQHRTSSINKQVASQ